VISQVLCLVVRNLPLVLEILLVANQDPGDIFLCMLIDFAHPLGHLGEGVSVSDIVRHNNTMGPLVVRRRDSLESLLPGSVPNLELDGLAINIYGSDLEVNTNCWHEVVMEYIILNRSNRKLD